MAKNASPTPSVRESIDTPVTGTPRSPTTSAPWVARTISWTVKVAISAALRRARPRHVGVVDGEHVGTDDLVGLVPLARDQPGVVALGPPERRRDGGAPVGLGAGPSLAARHAADADGDLLDDRARPLR